MLLPLAAILAARKCADGMCFPGGPAATQGYIPVKIGTSAVSQTEGGRGTRHLPLTDERLAQGKANIEEAAGGRTETERIERIH
ncbi:unnamed protein product, partial [Didymodactylos carnosus]